MRKCKETAAIDASQRSITDYFSIQKGPLRIECENIITSAENARLSKLYRRNTKRKPVKIENIDSDDIEYVGTTYPNKDTEDNERPISSNILFRTEVGYTKFMNSEEMSSDESIQSVTYDGSPSKKQKLQPITGILTVTKSETQIKKIQCKVSRTLQMTQTSTINDIQETGTVIKDELEESFEEQTSLQETVDIANLLKVEIIEENTNLSENVNQIPPLGEIDNILNEDNSNLRKIKNHISLIDEIVDNTIKSHLPLLLEKEKLILESYQELTIYQKYFCCKLFTHQVKWYNPHKFAEKINIFADRLEIKQIVKHLEEKLIVKTDYSTEPTVSILHFLSADEVKEIHDTLRLKAKQKRKPDLIDAILEFTNRQTTLHPTVSLDKKVRQMVSNKLGEMVQISPEFYTMFYKIHLLYTYTNSEFDIPSGLYLRINEIKFKNMLYPEYICKDEQIFENAEDFSEFYKAFSYKQEIQQAMDKKGEIKYLTMFDLCKEIVMEFKEVLGKVDCDIIRNRPKHLIRYTAGHKYASTLSIACNLLSAKHPLEVREWLEILLGQRFFYQKKRGVWYSQLAVIYRRHLKEEHKAVEVLMQGLKDENVSLVDIGEIVYKSRSYCKMKKVNTEALFIELSMWEANIPDHEKFPSITINAVANTSAETARSGDYKYIDKNGDLIYMNVEQVAIRHYVDNEGFTEGFHCEGGLMQTLFCVLFWDIIYADNVPYTFVCKMQYLPLDFYTEEFYNNRNEIIDKRLSDIKFDWTQEYLESYVTETWNSVSEFTSLIVPNLIRNSNELCTIIKCIGRTALSDICQRLVTNFGDYRAGMPDLFVYNDNSCKFVEVKGPGDTLSTKQKLWIYYLLSVGITAEVCHVVKIGGNTGNRGRKSTTK